MLKWLRIDITGEGSEEFWSLFAEFPSFYALDHLELGICTIDVEDLEAIVGEHFDTLRVLDVDCLYLPEGAEPLLGNFYSNIRRQARLQRFGQLGVYIGYEVFEFPVRLCEVVDYDGRDEDDYVSLLADTIEVEGAEEVQELMGELAKHCQNA